MSIFQVALILGYLLWILKITVMRNMIYNNPQRWRNCSTFTVQQSTLLPLCSKTLVFCCSFIFWSLFYKILMKTQLMMKMMVTVILCIYKLFLEEENLLTSQSSILLRNNGVWTGHFLSFRKMEHTIMDIFMFIRCFVILVCILAALQNYLEHKKNENVSWTTWLSIFCGMS